MHFRGQLQAELANRRGRNPSYSLRAFARDLGTDHATMSQILRGRRTLSARMAAMFGRRLGLSRAAVAEAAVAQNAEAILRLAHLGSLRPSSRWIAIRTGVSIDGVNAALNRLVRERKLVMKSVRTWKVNS